MVQSATGASENEQKMPANPFDILINECNNDPPKKDIQQRYIAHRLTRATQQRARLLSPDFAGVQVDTILQRLMQQAGSTNAGQISDFRDERINLSVRVRPPERVKVLVSALQSRIRRIMPDIWVAPARSLHITALEVAFSLTDETIAPIVAALRPHFDELVNYAIRKTPRVVLMRPLVVYDAAGIALSFVPAAGTTLANAMSDRGELDRPIHDGQASEQFTYHHLRRDLFDMASSHIELSSRYVVPSCHITIARFVEEVDRARVHELVHELEGVNAQLERIYGDPTSISIVDGAFRDLVIPNADEWAVGEDNGPDIGSGASWYGEGTTLCQGYALEVA